MAAVNEIRARSNASRRVSLSVRQTQILALAAILLIWEGAGDSGFFYRGVFPPVSAISKALFELLTTPDFYFVHLATTAYETAVAFAIGSLLGIVVGLALGVSRYAGRVFEPLLYYVAPTPKIVFLPVLLVAFGVDTGSKIALGAVSCFFPMALSVASGVRQINPVLLRVGRSVGMSSTQMITKVYLPALRPPIGSGFRLGFGMAIIGCLLAELKLSNAGLGFLAMDDYEQFRIPQMYAVIIVVFALSAVCNGLIGALSRTPGSSKSS